MATAICSQCKSPSGPWPENQWAPFCSQRCKTLDLSRWLNGEYRVPAENQEGAEEAAAAVEEEKGESLH